MVTDPVIEITLNNVQAALEASLQKLVLFQFWSVRSEGCKQLTPILEDVVRRYPEKLLLARVDCDQQAELAMQFGVQSLPTVMIIHNGQPVDGFAGVETEQQILQRLSAYLPKPEDELLQQAQQLLSAQQPSEAYPLLKQAQDLAPDRADITILLADTLIALGQLKQAEEVLLAVRLADQDAHYKTVLAKLELAKEAADTPEIKALEQALQADPDNKELKEQLAVQYQSVQRSEEALALLLTILKQDLNFADSKKHFLDILATLPKGDPVAAKYRRSLYSLLY